MEIRFETNDRLIIPPLCLTQTTIYVYFVAVTHLSLVPSYTAADLVSVLLLFSARCVSITVRLTRLHTFRKPNCSIRTEWCTYVSFIDLIGPNRSVIIKPLYANTHIFILFVKSMMVCSSACNVTPQHVTRSLTSGSLLSLKQWLNTFFYWIKWRFDLNACVEQIAFQLPSIATQFDNECHCNRSSLTQDNKLTQSEWGLRKFVFMIIYFICIHGNNNNNEWGSFVWLARRSKQSVRDLVNTPNHLFNVLSARMIAFTQQMSSTKLRFFFPSRPILK